MVNALIVEDDPLACELLRTLLQRDPAVRVVAEVGTFVAAEVALRRNDYDVVFLDVRLIGGSGFELVPRARPAAAIIFVTAHDQHALRAFQLNAADYILKPVTAARLVEALRRAIEKRAEATAIRRFGPSDAIFLRGAAAGGRFVVAEQIVAIVSSENYSEVWLTDGERWLIRRTMQAWEAMLPAELFARVRRTAIVNLHYVERIERDDSENTRLFLQGVRKPLAVGRRVWPALKARLNQERRG